MNKINLHCHSTYSDGLPTLEELVIEHKKEGFDCFIVTDHLYSGSLYSDMSLNPASYKKQTEELEYLERKHDFRCFQGVELGVYHEEVLVFGQSTILEILEYLENHKTETIGLSHYLDLFDIMKRILKIASSESHNEKRKEEETVMSKFEIDENDYKLAAEKLEVSVAAIKAISEVESSGGGFDKQGRLKLLFEGHIFYKYMKKAGKNVEKLEKEFPTICYSSWNKRGSSYKLDQNERLKTAISLNEEIAYMSASYGRFQIMGFNFKECGHISAKAMYDILSISEGKQLISFCYFIKSNEKLHEALKKLDWATFAKIYNGPQYKQNNYDAKLAASFKKFS